MDRRDISMLYIKDQQVETVKQTERMMRSGQYA